MSTVDPELRWWRNARTLRIIAASLWVVVFAVAAVTGWSNALYSAGSQWATWAGADWLVGVEGVAEPVVRISQVSLVVVAWSVVVAGFVEGYARHRGGGGEGWALTRAFGWTLLGLGVGALVAVILGPVGWLVPTLLTLAGAACLLIEPVTHRIGRGYARRQDWARVHGTPAAATVTKADMDIVNDRYCWKATLKYEDAEGRTRWHTASIPTAKADKPRVGDRYKVRYDPEHPGRRAAIHVDLARPLNRRGR